MAWHDLCWSTSYLVLHYAADCLSTVDSLEEYVISPFSVEPYAALPVISQWRLFCLCLYQSLISELYNPINPFIHPSIHPSTHSFIYPSVLSFSSLSLTPLPLTVFSPVLLKCIFPPSLPLPSLPLPSRRC